MWTSPPPHDDDQGLWVTLTNLTRCVFWFLKILYWQINGMQLSMTLFGECIRSQFLWREQGLWEIVRRQIKRWREKGILINYHPSSRNIKKFLFFLIFCSNSQGGSITVNRTDQRGIDFSTNRKKNTCTYNRKNYVHIKKKYQQEIEPRQMNERKLPKSLHSKICQKTPKSCF